MSRVSGGDEIHRTPGVKLTYDDFLLFPDDDALRHELIDGEHYVTASPNTRHQRVSARLHLLIGGWLEANPIGELFYAPFDVVMSNIDIVEPDLLYISKARAAAIITPQHVRGVPELIIEIASPSTSGRDQTIKRALYERMGVSEYWIVDPDLDRVRVHRLEGDRFARPVELSRSADDELITPLLPGLTLPLSSIFRT